MAKAPSRKVYGYKFYNFQQNGMQNTHQIAFFQSYSQRNNGNKQSFGGGTAFE